MDHEAANRRDLVRRQGSERASNDFNDLTPEEIRAAQPPRLTIAYVEAIDALKFALARNTRAFKRLEIDARESRLDEFRAVASTLGSTAGLKLRKSDKDKLRGEFHLCVQEALNALADLAPPPERKRTRVSAAAGKARKPARTRKAPKLPKTGESATDPNESKRSRRGVQSAKEAQARAASKHRKSNDFAVAAEVTVGGQLSIRWAAREGASGWQVVLKRGTHVIHSRKLPATQLHAVFPRNGHPDRVIVFALHDGRSIDRCEVRLN